MTTSSMQLVWHCEPSKRNAVLVRQDLENAVSTEWFDAEYWLAQQAVTGTSTGRATAYFIHANTPTSLNMVLRYYYRGGLIAKLTEKRFLFLGWQKTRGAQELKLLSDMKALGLPVPSPIAAFCQRVGFGYENAILIERIDDCQDGFQYLSHAAFTPQQWRNIGSMIRRFHEARVNHADLNIHNILVDAQSQFWLIDFDRGRFMPESGAWQQANLQRLLRSLNKEKALNPMFHFNSADWQYLMDGYREFAC